MRSLRLASLGIVLGLGSVFTVSTAKADVLYGLSNNGSAAPTLYSVDTGTGAATAINQLSGEGINASGSVVGLGSLGGTSLYGLDLTNGSVFSFGTINNQTGQFQAVGSPLSGNLSSITAASGSAFYVVDNGTGTLEQITASTGAISSPVTITGAAGITFSGLALDTANTLLYAVGSDNQLYTINAGTGVAVALGALNDVTNSNMPTDAPVYGLTYGDGKLYLDAGGFDSNLYTVDTTANDGTIDLVGANGSVDGNGIGAIAFASPVPEPSTIALGALAIPALGVLVLKRRKAKLVPAPIA